MRVLLAFPWRWTGSARVAFIGLSCGRSALAVFCPQGEAAVAAAAPKASLPRVAEAAAGLWQMFSILMSLNVKLRS
jgi:hypothetical protein